MYFLPRIDKNSYDSFSISKFFLVVELKSFPIHHKVKGSAKNRYHPQINKSLDLGHIISTDTPKPQC